MLVCMFECARGVILMCTYSWWDDDVCLFAMYVYSWCGHGVCVILVWTRCEHDRGVNRSVGVGAGVCVITSGRGSPRACVLSLIHI